MGRERVRVRIALGVTGWAFAWAAQAAEPGAPAATPLSEVQIVTKAPVATPLGRASLFLKVDNLLDSRAASFGTYFGTGGLDNVAGAPEITSARTLVPLQPRSVEAGITLRW